MDFQLKQLRRGVHAVVGTPGRIQDHLRRKTLKLDKLEAVVIDEADEMLRMGFIEDVEGILGEMPKQKQVALFSATLPDRIRKVVAHHLNDPVEIKIKTKTATVAAVDQRFVEVRGFDKLEALTRILEAEDFDAMLIFVRTRQATAELSEKLEARGLASAALSGEMTQSAARTHDRAAEERQARHRRRDRRRGARPRRRAHHARRQLRHPARRRGLHPSHRPHGPGGSSGARDPVRDAARAAHARGDRARDAPARGAHASAEPRGRRRPARGAVQGQPSRRC